MKKLKIAIGSDHAGFALKEKIKKFLEQEKIEFKDFGTFSEESVDYPVIAKEIATAVKNNLFDRGILFCGTGVGMAITANRLKGIRAIVCSESCSAKFSRTHNDANILCLGQRIIGEEVALDICKVWLNTEFESGRHLKRVQMME